MHDAHDDRDLLKVARCNPIGTTFVLRPNEAAAQLCSDGWQRRTAWLEPNATTPQLEPAVARQLLRPTPERYRIQERLAVCSCCLPLFDGGPRDRSTLLLNVARELRVDVAHRLAHASPPSLNGRELQVMPSHVVVTLSELGIELLLWRIWIARYANVTTTPTPPRKSPTFPRTSIGCTISAVQRIGLQLQRTALTVNAMPQKPRRQNATERRNAQLAVVGCKPLLSGKRTGSGTWALSCSHHPRRQPRQRTTRRQRLGP
jgi:hypothetical protein